MNSSVRLEGIAIGVVDDEHAIRIVAPHEDDVASRGDARVQHDGILA